MMNVLSVYQDGELHRVDQPLVRRNESQLVHLRRCRKESICGILVGKLDAPAHDGDLVSECRFAKRNPLQHVPHSHG